MFRLLGAILTFGFISSCSSGGGNVTLMGAGSVSGLAQVFTVLDPTEMNIKVYKFAVSASTDCSSPITIYENESPTAINFLGNPTIGSGALDDGTYPCIIMEVSDNITFRPEGNEGACVDGELNTIDICRADSVGTSTLINGDITTCTGTNDGGGQVLGDDRVAIYLSTSGTDEGEAFSPESPITLQSAFTVSGTAIATFIVDGSGQVQDQGSSCDMGAPVFAFQ